MKDRDWLLVMAAMMYAATVGAILAFDLRFVHWLVHH
jgi:hypothetical protein